MGRPVYSYELTDPDFSWLINNFRETRPDYISIDSDCLPVVFIADYEIDLPDAPLPFTDELCEVGQEIKK